MQCAEHGHANPHHVLLCMHVIWGNCVCASYKYNQPYSIQDITRHIFGCWLISLLNWWLILTHTTNWWPGQSRSLLHSLASSNSTVICGQRQGSNGFVRDGAGKPNAFHRQPVVSGDLIPYPSFNQLIIGNCQVKLYQSWGPVNHDLPLIINHFEALVTNHQPNRICHFVSYVIGLPPRAAASQLILVIQSALFSWLKQPFDGKPCNDSDSIIGYSCVLQGLPCLFMIIH